MGGTQSPQYFTASHSLQSNTDSATGAVSDTGYPLLEALGALVLRGAEGLERLALLAVNEDGLISVLHSLFLIGESAYKDGTGELFAIRGETPADGLLAIVQLKAIHFAANSSFVGTLRLDFEGHLYGLTSSLPRDSEDSVHQPAVKEEDNSARLVKSCGLAFFPCVTVYITLKQGPRVPITEVISHAFAGLGIQDRVFDPALNWMQASLTAQADETYYGHIRMRQDTQRVKFAGGSYRGNALLIHLCSAFPGHFLPDPGVDAVQKEERVERSAGAEAGANAGAAGLHADAGMEDPQNVSHSVSAGQDPYWQGKQP